MAKFISLSFLVILAVVNNCPNYLNCLQCTSQGCEYFVTDDGATACVESAEYFENVAGVADYEDACTHVEELSIGNN